MRYTLQISALSELPLSLSDISVPDWGHALIRSRESIITGVLFDISASALSDYPLDYLSAVRNCIFSPDQEASIRLDNEGQSVYIELNLRQDGSILTSINLSELSPDPFIEGAYSPPSQNDTKILNEIITENGYMSYFLTFPSSAASWCESVIALARNESGAYELSTADLYNYYDASGYVHDLEVFCDKIANGLDNRTIEEIIAEIQVSNNAPIIRPGPNNPNL